MKVILVESISDARHLINCYDRGFFNRPDVCVVALHPNAEVFLAKQGIIAQNTLSYLNNEAQHCIILKTEELCVFLSAKIHLVDQYGFTEAYQDMLFHNLRIYVTHILWILEILKAVCAKHSIDEIITCVTADQENMYVKTRLIAEQERFLGILARDYCRVHRLKFSGQTVALQEQKRVSSIKAKVVHWIAQKIAQREYNRLNVHELAAAQTLVVPGLSYRMKFLLEEIRSRHPNVKAYMIWEGGNTLKQDLYKIYLSVSQFFQRIGRRHVLEGVIHLDLLKALSIASADVDNNFNSEIESWANQIEGEWQDRFIYDDVRFSHCLAGKIKVGIVAELGTLCRSTALLGNVLSKIKPDLLMSMYSGGLYYMMAEFGRQMNFETLIISHGTHVPAQNNVEHIENYRLARNVILNNYKCVAVQTPWADKFLNYYQDKRPRLYSGPLVYSQFSAVDREVMREKVIGQNENIKVIVHASTQKIQSGNRRFHIMETLEEFLSTLADLVHAINFNENTFLIIRPHPACEVTDETFLKLLPPCTRMKIVRKEAFAEILSMADLLISYSSTCMEEALQNNIPVVVYDQWQRYNHFQVMETKAVRDLVRQPVYYLTDKNVLKNGLGRILDLATQRSLRDEELIDHKYPRGFRQNFYQYVRDSLNGRSDIASSVTARESALNEVQV